MEKFNDDEPCDNVSLALKINEIIDWINMNNRVELKELESKKKFLEHQNRLKKQFNL